MQTFDVTLNGPTGERVIRVFARSRSAAFQVAATVYRRQDDLAPGITVNCLGIDVHRPVLAF